MTELTIKFAPTISPTDALSAVTKWGLLMAISGEYKQRQHIKLDSGRVLVVVDHTPDGRDDQEAMTIAGLYEVLDP